MLYAATIPAQPHTARRHVSGILLFCFLIWFMGDLDRVTAWRLPIGIAAILLFGLTLVIGL